MAHGQTPASLRERAALVLGRRYREALTLPGVAAAIGCSPRTLQRAYADSHTSFSEELSRARLNVAAELLGTQTLGVDVVARLSGFAAATSLTEAFRRRYAMTPGRYRETLRVKRRERERTLDPRRE